VISTSVSVTLLLARLLSLFPVLDLDQFLLLLLLLLPTAEDAAISIISRLVISTSVSVTLPLARLLFLFPVLDLDRFLPRPPPHLQTATAATEGSRTRMSR
jgi:hypothetical protein